MDLKKKRMKSLMKSIVLTNDYPNDSLLIRNDEMNSSLPEISNSFDKIYAMEHNKNNIIDDKLL